MRRFPCFFLLFIMLWATASSLSAQQLRQPPDPATRIQPPITQFTPLLSDLRFADGSRFRVVPQDEHLRAELRVLSDGVGLLSGTWEISEPQVSGFRILSRVRLPGAGRQTRRLISPLLPVSSPGLYELRFRSASGLNSPVIRYSVFAAPKGAHTVLALMSPQPGQRILPGTVFRWAAVPGAAAYRLEILTRAGRLAGLDTPRPEATLPLPTLARLRTYGGRPHWRITAFSDDGQIIAVSERRPTGERSAQ